MAHAASVFSYLFLKRKGHSAQFAPGDEPRPTRYVKSRPSARA